MSTERWERTKQILEEALQLAREKRSTYLGLACGTDRELRAEVESLISSHEAAGSQFLAAVAAELLELTPLSNPSKALESEDRKFIGPYRLETKLGEGGMGQVWLAEQAEPVKRRVALKVIKGGMFDSSTLQRFLSERQSLAIMDHPAIAKVFDAGATPDGQPYFVMECVPGLPITDYCDKKRLKIPERLELFIKVCDGVQHAHQKAIIHRDLKPANILVQEVDGKPIPRIIDFGLAKAISPQITGESLHTLLGGFVGTPGYMSPEQCDPTALDVDTRSDVYSLGVLLCVLLTGCLPFQAKPGKERPLDEMLRLVREEDPPRPSTKVSTDRETSWATAEARRTEPKQLVSLLRGDLDWMTMKALERDRIRRYGTASELAGDIGRYLNHEPVLARPTSVFYRLRKYVRRHRMAATVAVGLGFLLAGFAVMQAVQVHRVTRERDRANRITEFMIRMFRVSDPNEARGNSITAREILDQASKDIDSGLATDPDVQAQMMSVMGVVYENLGLYSREQSLLSRAVEIQRRVLGPRNPDTLRSASSLGWAFFREGHDAEAEKLLRETLAIQRRVLGPEHPDTVHSMSWLGVTLIFSGRYEESEKLLRDTLEIRRRVLGPQDRETLVSITNLANVLLAERRYAEVEKVTREALEAQQRILGPDHPDTLNSRNILTAALLNEGHYTEEENFMRETLAIQQRVLGPEHPRTLDLKLGLAYVFRQQGHYSEAEKSLRETCAIYQRAYGPENELTAYCTYQLANLAAVQGRREQALTLLAEAVDHGLQRNKLLGIERDEDFRSLYGDPRFAALVGHAKERAAEQRAN